MKVAIVGLAQSGKTTLFGALTRQPVKLGTGSYGGENNLAVIEVPDFRVDRLIELFRPRKEARASIQFVDGAAGGGTSGGFGPQFLPEIRQSDALVAVIRAFSHPAVSEPGGGLDPYRDYRNLEAELILSDLDLAEKRLERMEKQDRTKPKSAQGGLEKETVQKIRSHLEGEQPLSVLELNEQEAETIKHLDFVTTKPLVIVANISESELGTDGGPEIRAIHEWASRSNIPVLDMCASAELEVAQLGPEEEGSFLEALGITESGRTRLIRSVYELLGLMSFFTVGEDEVKGWTIHQGTPAVQAAGKIHSDIERGFIRAEIFRYDDLIELGSAQAIKEKGRLRLEGKEYLVQDGDCIYFRFNV